MQNPFQSPYTYQPGSKSLDDFNQKLRSKLYLTIAICVTVSYYALIFMWLNSTQNDYEPEGGPPVMAAFEGLFVTTILKGNIFISFFPALVWGWAVNRYAKAMGYWTIVIGMLGFFITVLLESNIGETSYSWPPRFDTPLYISQFLLWVASFALQFHINHELKVLYGLKQVWFFRNPKEVKSIRTRLVAEEGILQLEAAIKFQNPQS